MAENSGIEWTDHTWNPLTGCTKVSPGCKHCYAETLALRLQKMGSQRYANGFALTLHPAVLAEPKKWKKPSRMFVNSMSDLLHRDVPLAYIQAVFQVMVDCPQHTFQVLTKRAERLAEVAESLPWAPNIWMGVSVESREYAYRIDDLRSVPAQVRFVSAEPLLGPLPRLNLDGIHWLIVGAESGHGARPMECDWARDLKNQCVAQGVAFFAKQKADRHGRKIHLPEIDGQQWMEYPGVPATLREQDS
jgi:protein gp37